MTPYYSDDLVTIYHGDFLDLPEVDPDLVVADPPYGVTSLAWDRWPKDWPSWVPGRSMWVFGTLRMFMDHASEFESWKLAQDIVWEKHNGSSIARDRFSRVHEQAVHFYRGLWRDVHRNPQYTMDAVGKYVLTSTTVKHLGFQSNTRPPYRTEPGGPRLQRSVIRVPSAHGYAENETQKPVGILTPLIEYGCPPGGLILDPFMGSGSTLIAARDSGRRAIGIDIREDQCEIAARRCQWLLSA